MFFKNILVFINIFCINSYNTMNLSYDTNTINFTISGCPYNIDCSTLIFNALDICNVPGSYRNFNLDFNNNINNNNINNNNVNNIVFTYFDKGYGKTLFSIDPITNIINSVDVYINTYKMDINTIYNILLHEFGHVMLLDHSDEKDSIMGYSIMLDKYNNNINNKKLKLTQDDCFGIYIKLINDIIYKDYKYAFMLNRAMLKNCNDISDIQMTTP